MADYAQGPEAPIPYARPYWTEDEVDAVARVVRSGWWTGGEEVTRLEEALRDLTGAADVVCMSSGTAAIHALLHQLKVPRARSLLVVPALDFVAAPAAGLQTGYEIALTDVGPETLNMSPDALEEVLALAAEGFDQIVVMPVHYAGAPADVDGIARVAGSWGGVVIEDACHALVARYSPGGAVVGGHARSIGAAFSFHPNKPVASGEGGAVSVRDPDLGSRLRSFRNHNMQRDGLSAPAAFDDAGRPNPWFYEVRSPGLNLRLSELHAALAVVQLERLPTSLERRRRLAARYDAELAALPIFRYFPSPDDGTSGLHLFAVSFDLDALAMSKRELFSFFSERGVALQVHYAPLFEQPAFSCALPGDTAARCTNLRALAPGLVSLPLFMGLADTEQDRVISIVHELAGRAA